MRWTAIAVGLLAMALAGCASEGSSPDSEEPFPNFHATVNGARVANPSQVLAEAEAAYEADAAYHRGWPSAMELPLCFFSFIGTSEIAPFIRCNPSFPGGSRRLDGPYTVFPLFIEASDGREVTLRAGRDEIEIGDWRYDFERLARPDGAADPKVATSYVTGYDRMADNRLDPFVTNFENCMADKGLFVFGTRITVDGQPSPRTEEITDGRVVLTDYALAEFEPDPDNQAIVDTCAAAAATGVGLVY